MIFPWSASARFIAHLEAEVEYLRWRLDPKYRPPQQQKKREHDPPPASLVEACSLFETHGPRLLQEAIQKHARERVPYDVIEQEIRGHIAAHSRNGGVE